MKQDFYQKLRGILSEEKIRRDEPMKTHTTFRVGGPADYFVMPETAEEVQRVTELCRTEEVSCYVIGNGSNLLVSDDGYRGVILQIYRSMSGISVQGNIIRAQAGALLSAIAAKACENSLTGFEFAAGIPGTIGGASVVNAGAYGGEMKDVLKSVTVLDSAGQIRRIDRENLEMGYRTSIISREGYITLEAEIELSAGNPEEIRARMDDLRTRRVTKQPLEYPSAGSTFKRPEGYFAGKLIQDAGLAGFQVGGAKVSEKHCGFVINKGGATCADVVALTDEVKRIVFEKTGFVLEREIRVVK